MPKKLKGLTKIDKLLSEKNKLLQVAHECKFEVMLKTDESQAFETLFEKLCIQKFTSKKNKHDVKGRIKLFFRRHQTDKKQVSYYYIKGIGGGG